MEVEQSDGLVSEPGNATRPRPLSIRRNMLFNVIGSLTYQGCLWLTTVLAVLLSDGYYDSGVLALAMTIGNMYTAIGTFSVRPFQVSDVLDVYSSANYTAFRVITMTGAMVSMVVYAAIVGNVESFVAVLAFLLFKADETFADVLYGVDQRYERMDYIGISQFVRGVLVSVAFVAGMLLAHSMVVAILGMFFLCLLVTLVYDIPHACRFGSLRPNITCEKVVTLLKSCTPIAVSNLLMSMVVSVARQYFGTAFGIEELGRYAAVATPAVIIQAAARYLYAPVLSPLAKQWNTGGVHDFMRRVLRIGVFIAVFAAVTTVLISVVGAPLLGRLYGESINSCLYLLPYVLASVDFIALLWFATDVLVVCRDEMGVLISGTVAMAVACAIMVPVENEFGMNGINFVVIAGMIAGLLCAMWRIRRSSKLAEGRDKETVHE